LRQESPITFEALYQEHGPRIHRFCYRLCGNAADAEDLTQDVFLSAFRSLHRFEGRSTVLQWLQQIALNAWRRSKRGALTTVALDEQTEQGTAGPDPYPAYLDLLSMEQAMEQLSAPQWEALVLVKVEGFKYREAAQLLGVPQGTVQYRVHQALASLRQLIAEHEPADPRARTLAIWPASLSFQHLKETRRLSRSLRQWRTATPTPAPDLGARISKALEAEQIRPVLLLPPPAPALLLKAGTALATLAALLLAGYLGWGFWLRQSPSRLPAELRRSLEGLARVRTARASGRHWTRYAAAGNPRTQERLPAFADEGYAVEFWHEAPDRYYRKTVPLNDPSRPSYLLMRGDRGALILPTGARVRLDPQQAVRDIAAFGVFHGGASQLAVVAGHKDTRTTLYPPAGGRRRVEVEAAGGYRWRLDLDATSGRVFSVEYESPTNRTVLGSFDYEAPLPAEYQRLGAP